MAFTTGTKTLNGQDIEILRIIAGGGNGTSPDSAIYIHTNGGGSPRQEMSMTETHFVAAGWVDK